MKSTIVKKKESEYPKLMISEDLVILFNDYEVGFVVNNTNLYKIGHFSEDWDMDEFEDFHGQIVLEK